ncbi:MAG TPA: CAP domain-containing protein [bacterium]|nr:CAP domain-containing protein [bacterium]
MSTRIVAMIAFPSLVCLALVSGDGSPASSQSLGAPGAIAIRLGYRAPASTVVPSGEMMLLGMVNQAREAHHLAPLVMNTALRKVARSHSRDMALDGYVGHDSPQGQSFLARLSAVLRGWTEVGENVTVASTVQQAHDAFMSSPSHLKNILDPMFRTIGIGIATDGDAGYMVTEDFAE